jgi:type I restriction enzyme S subunit
MSHYKPYPAYKDSGVEWIGEVPDHWEVKRLRHVASLNPSPNWQALASQSSEYPFLPMEAIGEIGELDSSRRKPLDECRSGYTYFAEGDVAYAKVTPCFENGKGAVIRGLEGGHGFGTTELTVLRPTKINADFLYALTFAECFRQPGASEMLGSGGLKRVPDDFARDYRAGTPPPSEQTAIAAALDRETTRIDALISRKTRFIELLQEKRQALITHAVTKGLDPNVKMKDSGVEWIGEVPEGWSVGILKRFVVFQRGHDLPSESRVDGPVPVVSSGGYSGTHNLAIAKAPGIVTGRYGSLGVFTFVQEDYWPLNTALYSIDFYNNAPRFIWYLLQNISSLFLLYSAKAAVPGIDRNDIHEILVAAPAHDEQEQIARHLDKQIDRLNAIKAKTELSIDLLKERRSAFITAAVTGQIDLRETA